MSENSWDLQGVDPAIRDEALEEAARRGVALSDYLTEILLAADQAAGVLTEPSPEEHSAPEDLDSSLQAPFAVRHRLDLIEKRLAASIDGLGTDVRELDGALTDLAGRIDNAGALAEDTAETVNVALQEIRASVAALRKRTGDAETETDALEQSNGAAHRALEQRLAAVECAASVAGDATAAVARSQEALKHAVAGDFRELAEGFAQRLGAGLRDAHALQTAAAERTDAAVDELMRQVRDLQATVEIQLADSAEQTRQRMQAAVQELAGRLDTVALRVADAAQNASRASGELADRLAEAEQAAESQFGAITEAMRRSGTELRADLNAVREVQQMAQARMKLTDAAIVSTLDEVAALRETVDRRLTKAQTRHDQTSADLQARFSAVEARAASSASDASQAKLVLASEIERVEACALAALEKLGADISASRATAHEFRAGLERDIAGLREDQTNAVDRVKSLETSLAAVREAGTPRDERLSRLESQQAATTDLAERLAKVEQATVGAASEQALAGLRLQVGRLAARADAERVDPAVLQRLGARLAAQEAHMREAAERADKLASSMSEFNAQRGDLDAQAEHRLLHLELGQAELHERASAANGRAEAEIASLARRVQDFDQSQTAALDALRLRIAEFIADNERRLAGLEAAPEINSIDAHLQELTRRDLAAEFEVLRVRVEERMLGVENRSVRALEQVSESIALLEHNMNGGDAVSA